VGVKRYGPCASHLARKLGVLLKNHLIDKLLQRLSIGGLSILRKMRNVSGETRNRAAAINVIPLGRGKIPLDVAEQWIGPYSPRLGDRCFELLLPLVHGFANHLRNERLLGRKVVIEASLRKPGILHQLREAYRINPLFPKKPLGCFEDAFSVLDSLFLRNAHWLGSSVEPSSNIALDAKKDNVDQNRFSLTHIKKTITVVSVNKKGIR